MSAQLEPTWDDAWFDDSPNYEDDPPDLPADELQALDRANWNLRMIAGIRAEKAQLLANIAMEIKRLEWRRDHLVGALDRHEAWWSRPLIGLHRVLRTLDEKRTSITLACGVLKSKGAQPKWVYDPNAEGVEDFTTFVEWAREHHPELLASRVVTLKVPDVALTPLLEALMALDSFDADAFDVAPAAPAKAEVKKAMMKKSENGKKVLEYGVDPATGEKVPGLQVIPQDTEFWIDTDIDA